MPGTCIGGNTSSQSQEKCRATFKYLTCVLRYVNQGRVTMTGWSLVGGDLGFATFPGGGYEQTSVVAYTTNQAWLPPWWWWW